MFVFFSSPAFVCTAVAANRTHSAGCIVGAGALCPLTVTPLLRVFRLAPRPFSRIVPHLLHSPITVSSYELALCKVVALRVRDARLRFQQKFPRLAAEQQQQQQQQQQQGGALLPPPPPPLEDDDDYRQTTITRNGGLASPPPPPPPPMPPMPVSVDALRSQLRASRATMSELSAAVRQDLDLEVGANSKQQE